ncbi:MAG: hypothetical protein ACYTE8_03350, partial [Planctomycetota bacterium]
MPSNVKVCLVLLLVVAVFAGCKSKAKEKPIWEEVKITDIPSIRYDGLSGSEMVQTANFDIYVFEIPDQNFEKLDEIWKQLTKQGIYLLDYHSFAANSFRADLGRVTMLTSINKILQDAGGRIANKFTLLIGEDESQDLEVAYLEKAQSIFYIS